MVKKVIMKSVLATVAGIGLMASSAMATPSNLYEILGYDGTAIYTDTGAESGFLTDTDGSDDDSTAFLFLKASSITSGISFGIYSFVSDSNGDITVTDTLEAFTTSTNPIGSVTLEFDLATGIAKNVQTEDTANIGKIFGWYITTGTSTYYSHTSENNNNVDHTMVFNTLNNKVSNLLGSDTVVAFDADGSNDFKDIVVGMSDVSPVPEPGVTMLFGLGVVGFAGVIRRRKTFTI